MSLMINISIENGGSILCFNLHLFRCKFFDPHYGIHVADFLLIALAFQRHETPIDGVFLTRSRAT